MAAHREALKADNRYENYTLVIKNPEGDSIKATSRGTHDFTLDIENHGSIGDIVVKSFNSEKLNTAILMRKILKKKYMGKGVQDLMHVVSKTKGEDASFDKIKEYKTETLYFVGTRDSHHADENMFDYLRDDYYYFTNTGTQTLYGIPSDLIQIELITETDIPF